MEKKLFLLFLSFLFLFAFASANTTLKVNKKYSVSTIRTQNCWWYLPQYSQSFSWKDTFLQSYKNGKRTPSPDVYKKYQWHRFIDLWNDPKLCAFVCDEWYHYAQKKENWIRIDYCAVSTWSLLLETKSKICYWNIPSNATRLVPDVYVDSYFCVWNKGCQNWRSWSDADPTYPCSYKCNEWYGFANWWCNPQRFQACVWSLPANAISNASATWYIQTLINKVWRPLTNSNSNYTWHYSSRSFLCSFKCNVWFSWKNWQCVTSLQ